MHSKYCRAATWTALAAVSLTAASIASANPASATGHQLTGIVYVDDVWPSDRTPRKRLTVDCPGVTYLVGAGYSAGDYGGHVRIERVEPSLRSLTVVAQVHEDSPQDTSWSLGANLVCANRPPGHRIEAAASVSSSDAKNAIASCDPGEEALGGGFRLPRTDGELSITRLDVDTRTVNVTVHEDDTGYAPRWEFTTFAICALPISGRAVVETDLDVDDDGQVENSWCAAGRAALSAYGGFDGGEGNVFLSALSMFLLPQFGDASAGVTAGNVDDDGTTLSHDMYGGAVCVDL